MHIRDIGDGEIDAIAQLLAEGFPTRRRDYWRAALARIAARPCVSDLPRIGYALEVDGVDQGVILLLSSAVDGVVRSNLSSWYVREDYRKYATFLFQRAIRNKNTVYLNLSPSIEALPIAKAFGFKPYTGGTLRVDARGALRRGGGRVHRLTGTLLARLSAEDRETVRAHLSYGCRGFVVEDAEGLFPVLYRTRFVRRIVPSARLVAGPTERLLRSSGAVARYFLSRGVPFFVADAPPGWQGSPPIAYFPEREIRYAKNAPAPAVGDLRETEMAVFFP